MNLERDEGDVGVAEQDPLSVEVPVGQGAADEVDFEQNTEPQDHDDEADAQFSDGQLLDEEALRLAQFRIVPRQEWRASAPRGAMSVASYPMREWWLHHSVTTPTNNPHADMRQIQQVAFSRGFSDCSYTHCIHPSGMILEGRSLRYIGAHTKGHNAKSLAVCLIGNYEQAPATHQQVEAVRWLRGELIRTGFLAPGTYPTGGHRDTKQTACPGTRAYQQLHSFRENGNGHPPVHDTLRRGSRGDLVRHMQELLVQAGHNLSHVGGVDGIFGRGTEGELRSYQGSRNLAVDGICGPKTWTRLHQAP